MSRALAHRGPDGAGIEIVGRCGLVHRRLSIIDLSDGGRQPMTTEDRRLWLSYNGEVYNYLELRADLEKLGHRFRSASDAEVVLVAYRAWGDDAFARFNGMWSLAIYDSAERKLVLSRDRFGKKPLYYHHSAERLMFASEVKALLAAEPGLAELDQRVLARFLERSVVGHGDATYWKGVVRFPPATVITIHDGGRTEERRYWRFLPPSRPMGFGVEQAAEQVRELLADAVKLRFRADVPVGTCLSGGIDSSSIVALAAKKIGKAPETFSAIYSDPEFSEGSFVRTLVNELGLRSNEVSPDGTDLRSVMERATYYQEEPTASPGIYSQWQVMKIAAPKVKVLLDGQGGDELFGGYFFYFETYMRSLVDRVLAGDLEVLSEMWAAEGQIEALTGQKPLKDIAKRVRDATMRRLKLRSGPGVASRTPPLFSSDLRALLRGEEASWPTARVSGDRLTDLLWDQLVRTSIPALLQYEDRDSMAHSIEARVPFLDYRLVELAFSLPTAVKIRGARTKVVLREAMKGVLPEAIRERSDKKGYPTPFSHWIRRGHDEWLEDLLCSQRTRTRGFFVEPAVRQLLDEHRRGAADHGWRLWQLATTELFLRRYFDAPFAAEPPPPKAVPEP
jgi:asparagine synthase (glutamine-hydrolysing)